MEKVEKMEKERKISSQAWPECRSIGTI